MIAKKIIAWMVVSTFICTQFSFSYANWEPVTSEDKAKVEKEILALQWQLLNNSQTFLEKMTSDFKKLTHYEEKGDLKLAFEMDQSLFWKWTAQFDMKNYAIKNALLDSDISGDMSLKSSFDSTYGSGVDLDLSTFFSLISKDGEIYALLKDFNFQVNDENIKEITQKIQEQFKDNKYVKLPSDPNSQMMYQYLQGLNTDIFFNQMQDILAKPLLQTYKKSGDKYLLVPTLYACETYFELDKKLNLYNSWYTPKTCSSSVYKAFVKEFIKQGELYLKMSENDTTLGFDTLKDDTTIHMELTYDAKNIQKVDFMITPDQKKYKNEWFQFSYIRNESLQIHLNADSWKIIGMFDGKLDMNNHFQEITSQIKSKDFNGNFSLKNKKITWFYTLKERGYDYNSDDWAYILKNIYGVKITGDLDDDNSLQKLNLKAVWVDVNSKEVFLKTKASYENGNYAFEISSQTMFSTFDMKGSWYISQEKFALNSEYNSNEMYSGKLNINYDSSNNKNNLDFYFDISEMGKQVAKLTLSNIAVRTYKEDIKIEIPQEFNEFDVTEMWELLNY